MTADDRFTFSFDGRPIAGRVGQSLAAALTEAGVRAFRRTPTGADRGMFCGMGVCQECLVEVDGRPNVRACMTKARPAALVCTQAAHADLSDRRSAETPALAARRIAPDVLVIGGGAGGLNAAIAAANAGAAVVVLDERQVAGGQYYKQGADARFAPALDSQQAEGANLLARAHGAGVEIITGAEVWGAFEGPLFLAQTDDAALAVKPRTAIIATGAYERPLMVPGWDLPGVITTGAAQTLWRSYRTLPGRRVAVCGSGPLNFQVALELAEGGADLAMVAESAPPPWTRPGVALTLFAADPRLAGKGAAMVARLTARGARPRFNTCLTQISTTDDGLAATFETRGGHRRTVTVDALCMNGGFQPQNEILRLLGVEMTYDARFDQLRPRRESAMETSVAGVYAIGDCCGLGGAPAAVDEGMIAGHAAALACGFAGDDRPVKLAQRRLSRHRRFQNALWRVHRASAGDLDQIAPEVLICRCEEVTKAMVCDALDDDPHDIGSVKRATRLGMGRCQGRYCGPALARALAARTGRAVEDLSFFAPRVPIKPIAISNVLAAQRALDED